MPTSENNAESQSGPELPEGGDDTNEKKANSLTKGVKNQDPRFLNPGDAIDFFPGDQPGDSFHRKAN